MAALAKAAVPTYVFHQLSIKDGLSEGTVRAIVEDKRGFMWFATEDGLNKYDGYKFTVFKPDLKDSTSISSNNIKCFYNDKEGNLWIGTRLGINIYDHIKDRFYNSYSPKYAFLKYVEGDVERILEDKNGILWIATSTHGLYKVTDYKTIPQRFQYPEEGNASVFMDIDADGKGGLYISTNDGLLRFDTLTNTFQDLRGSFGRGYQIRDLYLDPQNRIWMATTQGLKRITASGQLKEYEHNPLDNTSLQGKNVIRILPQKEGLLLAIDGSGIDLFNPETEIFYHYNKDNGTQLNSNNTTAIYSDTKGTLWTGTFLNGINFSNVSTNFFVAVKNNSSPGMSVKNGVITSFLKDAKGDFWISTDGGGLYLKKKGAGTFQNFNAADKKAIIESDAVLNITEDADQTKWISTYAGGLTMLRSNGTNTIFKHNPQDSTTLSWNKIRALCEYNNEIWVSTYAVGVSVYNKATGKFRHYRYKEKSPGNLPSDWVYWLLKDSHNNLWLATFQGLCKYIPETDQFKTYQFNNSGTSVDKNYVFEIIEDRDKNIWLGTNGGGLVHFDPVSEKFTSYTVENGLSDNAVRTIIQDNNGDLWLGTNNGITQFDVRTRKAISYKIHDGLPPGSFFFNSKYKDEKGKIYFGMNDGYLMIDPSLANELTDYPDVILTEMSLFNVPITPNSSHTYLDKHISQTTSIRLPYDKNSIGFEFAALNFNTPKHNVYAYMLEGFDKDWNYTGKNRIAKYTNLDPGTYVFKVKASNNQKLWGKKDTAFTVVIAAPFWATFWFRGLAVLLLGVVVWVAFYLRTKSIRDRNRWLTEQVDAQTRELKGVNHLLAEEKDQVLAQQEELLEKKSELEKSNAQMAEWSQFQNKLIGIISHDIRGPLRNFSMLLELQDEQSSEWIKATLKETAQGLSLLATDLLSWVSLQSQKGEVQMSEFAWSEVIRKAKEQLTPSLDAKKLQFVVTDNETQLIQGVAPMVLACMRNILSNSIRFSPNGGVIEIETGLRNKGYAGLRITDFGNGFDADRINKLIQGEAFTGMKDSSLKESAGLGLAICYDMLKRTGGWAEAASLPGSGATFYIYLPLAVAPEMAFVE